MESHLILFHKKNLFINPPVNNIIINKQYNYISNIYKSENNIESPYFIPGILNKKRKYDEKYNLNNFISVFQNEKPKIIGGGSFGQVFLVMNTINDKLYAIKHMSKESLSSKLNSLEGIYKEIYIQSRIDHPNILPILYVKETSTDFHLVLEYASGGSLFQFIRKNKYLDEPLAFSLFIQVVNAIYFLHKNNLIHRDIKPENILLFENNTIKLCDFGWCVKLEEGQQRGTFCGTTEYMSPELVNHEEYSKEIDVWSLGVLLYEMVHGYSPFRPEKPDFNAKDVIENIRLHKLKFHKNISEECKELIYHLLDEDPIKRYKVEEIFSSDFVKFYEKRNYALPDSYLFEKYKFKLSKFHSCCFSKNKNSKNNNTINHSKSFSNNAMCKDIDKIDDSSLNYNNISNNENMIYTKKKKNLSTSFSDINLKCFKSYKKKLKKNNTSQYFHPLNIIENKINFSYIADSKSKKNSQRKMITNYNTNEDKENNNSDIPQNETKIKTIIINNYFPNVIKSEVNNNSNTNIHTNPNNSGIKVNDIPKNNKENNSKSIPYKKSFHIKPLKMSKIPINTKIGSSIHSPTNKLNTILERNYLIMKKHLSPKVQLNMENIKTSSFQISKNNDSKIIEVNKTKYCKSPKIFNDIPNPNRNNFNKKPYTRNNITTHHENLKGNYNSEVNYTSTNLESNNNNSYANYLITSNEDEYIKKKMIERKLYNNKPVNQLKRNFSNENIKSMFISNIKNDINNLNNNSLYYENKCVSNKNTIHIKGNSLNLNMNDIKKINTGGPRTKQNSPLSSFNNNFIYTIFNNKNKKQDSENKTNIQLRNNIGTNSSYNYINNNKNNIIKNTKLNILNKEDLNYLIFPKIKVHKTSIYTQTNNYENNSKYKCKCKINLDKILNDNDINSKFMKNSIKNIKFYDKCSKLLNSMSQNSIFQQNKNTKGENRKKITINNNRTETNKKIKNIPKIKSFKKNENLNINININNKRKHDNFENYRCNSNSNINNKKLLSLEFEKEKMRNKKISNTNREISSKGRNNSNKENNKSDLKCKIIKKLEVNEFMNNININKENKNPNIITTSSNKSEICKISRINTSINHKNIYDILENNKQKYEDYLDNKSYKNSKYNFDSKNYDKYKKNNDINWNNNENKSLNINNKIKIMNKKDTKIILSPKIAKNNNETNKEKINNNTYNIDNKFKKNLRYNQNNNKGFSNGIIMDKYKLYKKENFV